MLNVPPDQEDGVTPRNPVTGKAVEQKPTNWTPWIVAALVLAIIVTASAYYAAKG